MRASATGFVSRAYVALVVGNCLYLQVPATKRSCADHYLRPCLSCCDRCGGAPPHVVVGLGQGATVAAFACHPQVRAAVYGHRFVMDAEKESFEAAANGVAQWFFVRAAATLRHEKMPELFEAVPEFTPLREVWTHH